jgi:peptidoglycan hydrolase CwlO-like protein
MEVSSAIAVLIGALFGGGGIASLVAVLINRGKVKAEEQKTVGEAWAALVAPMQAQIDALQHRIATLECDLGNSRDLVERLQDQVHELQASGADKDETIAAQAQQLRELEADVAALTQQVQDLGQKPRKASKGATP